MWPVCLSPQASPSVLLICLEIALEPGDLGVTLEGKDENDVMAKAADHARKDHNITHMTPDLEEKVRGAIHEKR